MTKHGCMVQFDEEGTWHAVWPCGDSAYGVDDGDLARARATHVCLTTPLPVETAPDLGR